MEKDQILRNPTKSWRRQFWYCQNGLLYKNQQKTRYERNQAGEADQRKLGLSD